MTKRETDTIVKYEQACNALAREFETILLRDYEDETEEYTPSGYWCGDEIGGVYCFADDCFANVCDMAVMLCAIEDREILPDEAYPMFFDWEDWMCRASYLKSTSFGAENKRIHFINLKSWIKGFPNKEIKNAIVEAENFKAKYEEAFNKLAKDYGLDNDTGFPKRFNKNKK